MLEIEPANADANFALARIEYAGGDADAALARLRNVGDSFRADGLSSRIELEQANGEHPRLAEAFAKLDENDRETGLDILLDELAASAPESEDRERLRKVIVAVLDELGVEHPLARESRRRLAAALY